MASSRITVRWLYLALFQMSGLVLGEIEKLKNCGKKALCNVENPKLYGDKYHPSLNNSSPCYCDEDCLEYGDCCVDIVRYQNYTLEKNKWTCVPLSLNQSVYAVSNCDLSNSYLKYKCEKNVPFEEYHYLLDIPVYSNLTGAYYANIYCAYCHEILKSITMPHLSITCSNNITTEMLLKFGVYLKGKLAWQVGNSVCSVATLGQITNTRPCVVAVSKCPSEADPILSAQCNAYSMISSGPEKMYRNPHCALCNGLKMSDLRCWYGYKFKTLPSFSTIFNFEWKFNSCEIPESTWDALQQRCTSSRCPVGRRCNIGSSNYSNTDEKVCDKFEDQITLNVDGYLTYICLSVSIVCLLMHMIMSAFRPRPKTVPAKILDSLVISLMFAQTLFLCGIKPFFEIPNNICHIVAILIHFFFLASFFWMNAISIDVWSTFSNASMKNNSEKSHKKYAFYAWGSAAFVTAFSITAEQTNFSDKVRPYYAANSNICWFGNPTGLAVFFYFPILFLLTLNIILFTITVSWFQKHHNSSERLNTSGRKDYNRLWLYIKLSIIMGASWAFGMITSMTKKPIYRYPFTVLNGLQGAFIFIMFNLKKDIAFTFVKRIGFTDFRRSNKQGESDRTCSSRLSASSKGASKSLI